MKTMEKQTSMVDSNKLRKRLNASTTISPLSGVETDSNFPSLNQKQDQSHPLGKTPDGFLFPIPQTHDMLSSLFDPRLPKSHIDLLTLSLLFLQVFLFFILPRSVAQPFFLTYFAVWRLAYDAGLGVVLRKQSETRWIVKTVVRKGWMDHARRPKVCDWIKGELQAKMGKDYDFNVRSFPPMLERETDLSLKNFLHSFPNVP